MRSLTTMPKRDERGFTLIELLVVIIIIGILAAITIPLFLDQRKLAVDASVKSDVRNTATQVQTWQATNQGVAAADTTAYTTAGGKVSNSTGNTVNLKVAADGSYLVCGYAGTSAKAYTASTAAYVYDSTSGKFGLGSCTGGIVGSGSTSSAPAMGALDSGAETGETTLANWSFGGTGSGFSTEYARTGTRSAKTADVNYADSTYAPTFVAGATYKVTAYLYMPASNAASSTKMQAYVLNSQAPDFSFSPTTSYGSWVMATTTFTAKANTSLHFYPSVVGGGPLYTDDITIVQQ